MARKNSLIIYPDGSRKNVGRIERDHLLLSGDIKQIGQDRYFFTGEVRTYHAFAEIGELKGRFELKRDFPHYLPGISIVFELRGKRERQMEQTTEGLICWLNKAPVSQVQI